MSEENNLLDKKIEDYLHNRMNESDRIVFEKMMEQDSALRKDVKILVSLKLLYSKELLRLQQKIIAIEKELGQQGLIDS